MEKLLDNYLSRQKQKLLNLRQHRDELLGEAFDLLSEPFETEIDYEVLKYVRDEIDEADLEIMKSVNKLINVRNKIYTNNENAQKKRIFKIKSGRNSNI